MNQKFSQDFTALFAWGKNDAKEEQLQKPRKIPIMNRTRIKLAAAMLDKTGVGISHLSKVGAVEMLKRINDFNTNNRLQYE